MGIEQEGEEEEAEEEEMENDGRNEGNGKIENVFPFPRPHPRLLSIFLIETFPVYFLTSNFLKTFFPNRERQLNEKCRNVTNSKRTELLRNEDWTKEVKVVCFPF